VRVNGIALSAISNDSLGEGRGVGGGGGGIRERTFRELPLSKVAFTQYAAGFVSTSKNSVLFLLIDIYFFSAICDERAGTQWGQ